jgi:transcriptional regulator with XRE-family HTH domain
MQRHSDFQPCNHPAVSYDTTAFGQRLRSARKAAGLTQKQAAAAVGMSQSNLAELEKKAGSSGYTVQLAALYNVSAEWLATGSNLLREEPPNWANAQHSTAGARTRGKQAHILSHPGRFDQVPVIAWETLMPMSAPNRFAVKCPDDSMSPFLRPGAVIYLERALTPKPGDIVLVQDSQGRFYLRLYRPRTASAWEGKPLNDLYQSLDSEREGLTLTAVFVGMEGRVSET